MSLAFRLQDVRALDALGLHLPAHGLDQIVRRHDILDLDAVDLDAPWRDRGIDHAQQPLVDLVTMRQHLIKVHRTHHRADVGHGQRDNGLVEVCHLIARLRSVEHLIESDAVHRHGGVVAGDDLLLGNVDHLLHHVHLAADTIKIRNDEIEARPQCAGVFSETLDGPVVALRHRFHAGEQSENDE